MNFVALALLEACGGNDENAFWILAGMCENLELEVSSPKLVLMLQFQRFVGSTVGFMPGFVYGGRNGSAAPCGPNST